MPDARPDGATAALVLADGSVLWGKGFGAFTPSPAIGEICFSTGMTGYQETLTDPSFAGQIITFTFPHIGNVGANREDVEAKTLYALGCIVREDVTAPSNFRSLWRFDSWLKDHDRIGLAGVDTRALTGLLRKKGAQNAVIAHDPKGQFDIPALIETARSWAGLQGMDLARSVSTHQSYNWQEGVWSLQNGYSVVDNQKGPHVVAIDYGLKHNILRNLVEAGARVTVVKATASFDEVMAHKPDGVFLSNGPGDPAATAEYAVPVIRQLLDIKMPIFGICLGHQLLALAVGATTYKMHQGHRGANHPVKRLDDSKVEITSMNHGFAVATDSLPEQARPTHLSLFDGSLAGLELTDRPAFSVQYHPEASPGPQDSYYLFTKFIDLIAKERP